MLQMLYYMAAGIEAGCVFLVCVPNPQHSAAWSVGQRFMHTSIFCIPTMASVS